MCTNETIGGYIRQLRLNQSKGQKEIAVKLSLSVPAYGKIECGITEIGVTRLHQIAELFAVSPESLVVGEKVVHAMVEENKALKVKLDEMSGYCILLQGKVIKYYELMEELNAKGKEHDGMLDLLG